MISIPRLVGLTVGRVLQFALVLLVIVGFLLAGLGGGMLVVVGLALVTGLWASWTQSLAGLIAGFEPVL